MVEGLLSTGPTQSSLIKSRFDIKEAGKPNAKDNGSDLDEGALGAGGPPVLVSYCTWTV